MPESAGYWSPTRLNGAPLEAGTVCWVTTVPGQNPIPIYGKNAQEVIEKLSAAQAYAQAELARRTPNPAATPVVTEIPQGRQRLTADEIAQNTSDLGNPAKAGQAVAALVEDATGIDLKELAMQRFYAMLHRWQKANPDFNAGLEANKALLLMHARSMAGGENTMITPPMLDQAFKIMRTLRQHVDAAPALPPNPNEPSTQTPASSTTQAIPFPGESQVQRTERQRGTFATGTRSTRFSAPSGAPTKTPKYTKEDLIKMPLKREKELGNPKHPDHQAFVEAYEMHFGKAAMSA